MNARRVAAAEGVILAALKTRQTAAGVAIALESACLLQSPETADEIKRLMADRARWQSRYYEESRTYWDAELPPGGECCAECYQPVESEPCPEHHPATVVARLQARVAELEAAAAKVAGFCAQRAEYVDNLRNCNPDNGHDYDRWQGHAAARRQLSQLLGLPVGWPAEDQATPLPRQVEDPHESPLHHEYAIGRDLPEVPHA